jgi:hypothetical protein
MVVPTAALAPLAHTALGVTQSACPVGQIRPVRPSPIATLAVSAWQALVGRHARSALPTSTLWVVASRLASRVQPTAKAQLVLVTPLIAVSLSILSSADGV